MTDQEMTPQERAHILNQLHPSLHSLPAYIRFQMYMRWFHQEVNR